MSLNFTQSKNSVKIVLCIFLLMVFVPPVQTAGAIADELHAAPINPEYIRYMNENLSNSRMQGGTHRLGVIPSQIYRLEIRDIQMFGPNTGDLSSGYP